jgi:hypothetical protein
MWKVSKFPLVVDFYSGDFGGKLDVDCLLTSLSPFISPICSTTKLLPGLIIVKMGMFPRIPEPEMEIFADHRHDWQAKHKDMPMYKITPGQGTLE